MTLRTRVDGFLTGVGAVTLGFSAVCMATLWNIALVWLVVQGLKSLLEMTR